MKIIIALNGVIQRVVESSRKRTEAVEAVKRMCREQTEGYGRTVSVSLPLVSGSSNIVVDVQSTHYRDYTASRAIDEALQLT